MLSKIVGNDEYFTCSSLVLFTPHGGSLHCGVLGDAEVVGSGVEEGAVVGDALVVTLVFDDAFRC